MVMPVLTLHRLGPPGHPPAGNAGQDPRPAGVWISTSEASIITLRLVRGVAVVDVLGRLDIAVVQPCPLLAALERQQVEDLYEIVPTVAQGIERREGRSLAGRRRGELEVIPPGGRQLVTAP